MTNVSKLWPREGVDPINWWGYMCGAMTGAAILYRPFLVCFRGVAPYQPETHPLVHEPSYKDTGVLVHEGGCNVFPMASYAYQKDSKLSPDVNGDKRGDVGSIRPGKYTLEDSGSKPYPIFILRRAGLGPKHLLAGNIPCWRDTDHNGYISEDEMKKSEEMKSGNQVDSTGCFANSVLMHTGFDAPANSPNKYSIACQTANVMWLQLMRDACASHGKVIDYHLINAADALKYTMPEEIPDIVA